jgi:hypothetical protein
LNLAVRLGKHSLCQLLVAHGANPFLEVPICDKNDEGGASSISPFQTATQSNDTEIFEYLLGLWDESFPSNGGKNDKGEYPVHVICRDNQHVSLSAIKVLLAMDRQLLYALDKHAGLFPFHIAAQSDASVDVIYTLFQHCADQFTRERL